MRISELAARSGVSVPTIKFYLRQGLLPDGVRTSATQAVYGEEHVTRLRVIRALTSSGVSIADARSVIATIDSPPDDMHHVLGAAHAAVSPTTVTGLDVEAADALVRRLGGDPDACDASVLNGLAAALERISLAGFTVADDTLDVYLDAMSAVAQAEIDRVPMTSIEDAVEYVALGTVLAEPLLLALRRVAQQVASQRRFGADGVTQR